MLPQLEFSLDLLPLSLVLSVTAGRSHARCRL
jgi:hypothetical protein